MTGWRGPEKKLATTVSFKHSGFNCQMFILFSALLPLTVHLVSLALRVTCIRLPNFPLQVVKTLTNTTLCKFNQVDVQAPGMRRRRPRMEALQYLGIIQVFSLIQ